MNRYREDFLILQKKINGKPIIYLDNACVTLKPVQVTEKMNEYYNEYPACAGRSVHKLSAKVTVEAEEARKTAAKFFNAKKESEIIFTRNTTEGINLVANSIGIKPGDSILSSDREHNSNLIPWQMQAKKGAVHDIVISNDDGTFNLDAFKQKLMKNVKLVSVVHTSNLDGYTLPIKEIIKLAHDNGSLAMVDAAQSAPHQEIDVRKLDVDFLACSGHKMLGPSGIGLLYGKQHLLEQMTPFIVGGETVKDSTYTTHTFEGIPHKFEAGLQNYSGIVGLGAALKYLKKVGLKDIKEHELKLNTLITEQFENERKVKLLGPKDAKMRSGIYSFNIEGLDPHVIALTLDKTSNIMTRSGMHCVHSWFNAHKINGSARASMYFYNTKEECEVFCEEIKKLVKHFT